VRQDASVDLLLTGAQVRHLAEAAADADQPCSLLKAIDEAAAAAIGSMIFTANRFEAETMEVSRLYSSNPAAYPVGGRKRKRDTAWGQQVLIERRLFIAAGEAAIRAAFDDHVLIFGLGVRAIINVPAVFAGRCLGTLNFLMPCERVGIPQVSTAALLGLIATAAFRAASSDSGCSA
jgi:GAF domain-containing protein